MRLHNVDQDIIIPDVAHHTSVLDKVIGLRFKKEGRAFFSFRKPVTAPVDMFLVPRKLDLAFLDEQNTIIDIQEAHPVTLHPKTWRTYTPDQRYQHLLEVEHGLLEEKGFAPGDTITRL